MAWATMVSTSLACPSPCRALRMRSGMGGFAEGQSFATAPPDATVSKHPRCPHGHSNPLGSMGRCPISPMDPLYPCSACPPRTSPAASPVPKLRNTTVALPSTCSTNSAAPTAAAFTSFSTCTGACMIALTRSPSSNVSISRLTTLLTCPVAQFTCPGMPMPMGSASLDSMRATRTMSVTTLLSPECDGIRQTSMTRSVASSSTPSIFVPPMSMPTHPCERPLWCSLAFIACTCLK